MKKIICDIKGCNEEAAINGHKIKLCVGYKISCGDMKFDPFEYISIDKKDLCEKHLTEWAKLTYNFLMQTNKEE